MKINTFLLFSVLIQYNILQAQTAPDSAPPYNTTASNNLQKMQWFADAKLGIFIHEGIYAVNGIDESWSFYNKKISYEDYMEQLNKFTLKNYNPEQWANLIDISGAKYAVITTKHHDGVAMYDTKMNNLSTVKATPSKKDLIKPLFEELRKRNIKCGTYFSLLDWSNDNYTDFLKDKKRYEIKNDYNRWNKFRDFFQGQIKEIGQMFSPDLWWFDGDWEHSAEEWEANKIRQLIIDNNKNAIINSRLPNNGDYETPEQNFPVSPPKYNYWELCMTMNNNWGYQPNDKNWKTPSEIVSIFVDVVSNGGNLLLDIGPKEDGTIPNEAINILKELGEWNKKHQEAIFKTTKGIPQGHFYGPTTLSKDKKTLYLFVYEKTSGNLLLKGLKTKIEEISILSTNKKLNFKIVGKISWSPIPGLVYINLPENNSDKYITVLKVKLTEPLELYNGEGGLK